MGHRIRALRDLERGLEGIPAGELWGAALGSGQHRNTPVSCDETRLRQEVAGEPWSGGRARTRLWALDTDSGRSSLCIPRKVTLTPGLHWDGPVSALAKEASCSSNESPRGETVQLPRNGAWRPSALTGAGQELRDTRPSREAAEFCSEPGPWGPSPRLCRAPAAGPGAAHP